MKFLYKLEKKFGKYAIKNLSIYIVGCFVIGYILSILAPNVYSYVIFSPYHIFVEHQIWRIFTWIFTTPGSFSIFTLVMLFFYYSIGTSIERAIGTFMYNLYIFGGIILSTVGVLIASAISYFTIKDINDVQNFFMGMVAGASMTYYMCISIFLGFALMYSDSMVLLWFIIPFKVKWMAYIDLAFLAWDFIVNDNLISRVTIVACVLNFFIFYFIVKKANGRRRATPAQRKKQKAFKKQVSQAKTIKPDSITRHKCAICGATEKDGEDIEFRFCSKCKGNYEYCNKHLFTHEHIK